MKIKRCLSAEEGRTMSNDLVIFKDGDLNLEVKITPQQDTVWLTQVQISELFDTARSSIAYHINNIFKEEELLFVNGQTQS